MLQPLYVKDAANAELPPKTVVSSSAVGSQATLHRLLPFEHQEAFKKKLVQILTNNILGCVSQMS